ncbi:TPA: hypothetical protein VA710_001365 [Streptococcus agalactiae]|nr:hypothetical protein [Streptococcus agalactiae]
MKEKLSKKIFLLGLTSMFVCPIIGLIGLIFGVKEKDKLFMALNILLILLLPIVMFASHLVGFL